MCLPSGFCSPIPRPTCTWWLGFLTGSSVILVSGSNLMEEEKRPLPGGVPSEGMLFDFELVSYRGPTYVLPRLVLNGAIIEETYTTTIVIVFFSFKIKHILTRCGAMCL